MTRLFRTATIVAVSSLFAACTIGGDLGPEEVPIEQTTFASTLGVNLAASSRTLNGAYYRDITVGTGALITNGTPLSVRYTGWLSNGQQFDSNAGSGAPYPFTLGAQTVIPGWEEALQGIRVGGKRQLIIPPALAYGRTGYGPIPPNAVLVFNVEVVSSP